MERSKSMFDVNREAEPLLTPLMIAATEENIPVLLRLLASDDIRNTVFNKDRKGRTALDYARMCRNYHAVTLLLKAMDSSIKEARLDSIALAVDLEEYIRVTNRYQSQNILNAMKNRNVDLVIRILNENRLYREEVEGVGEVFFTDSVGHSGYTPLILASGLNMTDVVNKLIEYKVVIDKQNKFGHTAFTYSCAAGNAEMARLLLFNGANAYHQTLEGRTGMHYACLYAKAKTVNTIIKFLLEQFATFRISNHSVTEFDFTRWATYAEILEKLINTKDNAGHKAIDLLPSVANNAYDIEARLRLSLVKSLDPLNQHPGDDRSTETQRDFEDVEKEDIPIDYDEEKAYEYSYIIERDNIFHDNIIKEIDIFDENDDDFSTIASTHSNNANTLEFSHDTDNAHVQGLKDAYSIKTALPNKEEIAIIKSIFEKTNMRLSEWYHSSMTEEKLSLAVPCSLECGANLSIEHIIPHVRDECPKRAIRCFNCQAMIPYFMLDIHIKKNCPKRIIACPNVYKGCKEMFNFDMKDTHLNMRCKLRPMCCRQFCEAIIPLNARDDHEEFHCKNRRIKCDQCRGGLIANEYSDHLHNICPERIVNCKFACGLVFKAKDVKDHEDLVCVQPCKWKCGAIIGPNEKLKLHEFSECLLRPRQCKYQCSIKHLTAFNINEHEKYHCEKRTVLCSSGCGEIISVTNLMIHQDAWCGDCPERSIRCPHNMVGWKIMLLPELSEGIVTNYRRTSTLHGYENKSRFNEIDQLYIKFPGKSIWVDYWSSRFVLIEYHPVDKSIPEFNCGWLLCSDINEHLNHKCDYRNIYVKGESDLNTTNFKGYKSSYFEAPRTALRRKEIDDHMKSLTNPNFTYCEFCSLEVASVDLPDHLKYNCAYFTTRCPFGCGAEMQRKFLDDHVNNFCPKRRVPCLRGCDDKDIWAEELDEHMISKCVLRPAECNLGCGDNNITVKSEEDHRLNKCPWRPIQCSCGLTFRYENLEEHQTLFCIDRLIFCTLGCGEKLKEEFMLNHTEFFCKNKNYKYQAYVSCPNLCGEVMMKRDVIKHVSYNCPKRLSECPLKCGNVYRLDSMKDHLQFCPYRLISCESGMKSCEKYLYQWFYKETPVKKEQQLVIDSDNSNRVDISTGAMKSTGVDDENFENDDFIYGDRSIRFENSVSVLTEGNYNLGATQNSIAKDTIIKKSAMSQRLNTANTNNFFSPTATPSLLRTTTAPTLIQGDAQSQLSSVREDSELANEAVQFSNDYQDKDINISHRAIVPHTSETALFQDEYQFKVYEGLRMCTCNRHNTTIMMSAINHNDEPLVEWIVRQTIECADIDFENIYGDTALILASRFGKDRMVEMLVQHGADINKETENGKTALIEAVKSKLENVEVVEYLIKNGAMVEYKTIRHRKTALDWSRLVKKPSLTRILELSTLVQRQTKIIFNAIACGDLNSVKNLVKDGGFFDPNVEEKFYVEMKRVGDQSDQATIKLTATELKMKQLEGKVEEALRQSQRITAEVNNSAKELEEAFHNEDEINRGVASIFRGYETIAGRLIKAELEHITRVTKPELVLRLAVFSYAIMFEILDMENFHDISSSCTLSNCKSWWPSLVSDFRNSVLCLRKIQSYSIDRLMSERAKPFINIGRKLFKLLKEAVEKEKEKHNVHDLHLRSETEENNSNVTLETKNMDEQTENNKTSLFIDSDSDHDDSIHVNSKGSWIKGEWVPKPKSKRGERTRPSTQESTNSSKSNKLIFVSDFGLSSKPKREINNQSEKVTPLQLHTKVVNHSEIISDYIECYPFIETILALLNAVVVFANDRSKLVLLKKKTAAKSMKLEDLKLQLTEAKVKYEEEFNYRDSIEKELIGDKKRLKSLTKKVHLYREKVRVARLLNQVSINGHTPVSWASSLGYYDIVEEMLSKGSTVGFPPELLNITATYLQWTYRICIVAAKIKPRIVLDEDTATYIKIIPEKTDTMGVMKELTILKDKRAKLLRNLQFQRSRLRLPVPEAIYTGKWELVTRIYERRLIHFNFMNQWVYPSAPPPFLRHHEHQYDHTKRDPIQILAHGMNDLASGVYVESIGWVPPNDPRETYGEMHRELHLIMNEMQNKQVQYQVARARIRILAKERINQKMGELEMAVAIRQKDFEKCIYLAEKRGITIDLETKEGFTALTAAAEENIEALNHKYLLNTDGSECLAVSYLLDRVYYRPSINLEAKSGHTALTKACILGRYDPLVALLDRGADINYQNKFGKTALHYAVSTGNAICTRILVERFADQTLRDCDGLTPYEIADKESFINIMLIISQFATGYLGPMQVARGRVTNIISCPNGCGTRMLPHEREQHNLFCDLREMECPRNCGVKDIMNKNLNEHLNLDCVKRPVSCQDCGMDNEFCDMAHHISHDCIKRMIDCPLGCGKQKKCIEMERHMTNCSHRIVVCPLNCDEPLRQIDNDRHVKNECINRRVSCPLKCRGLIVFKLLQSHLNNICPCRSIECIFCKVTYTKKQLEIHLKECSLRLEPCPSKCGDLVPHANLKWHFENSCRFRFVECSLLCGMKVREADISQHQNNECVNRLRDCEYGCVESELVPEPERVINKIPAKLMTLHLKYECPERLNRCSLCLKEVKAKLTLTHDQQDCDKRIVECRTVGCLKSLPFNERDDHERFTCRFRLVPCAQACGERVVYIHAFLHMTKSCVMRMMDCPLGCGVRMRYHESELHVNEECVRRHSNKEVKSPKDKKRIK